MRGAPAHWACPGRARTRLDSFCLSGSGLCPVQSPISVWPLCNQISDASCAEEPLWTASFIASSRISPRVGAPRPAEFSVKAPSFSRFVVIGLRFPALLQLIEGQLNVRGSRFLNSANLQGLMAVLTHGKGMPEGCILHGQCRRTVHCANGYCEGVVKRWLSRMDADVHLRFRIDRIAAIFWVPAIFSTIVKIPAASMAQENTMKHEASTLHFARDAWKFRHPERLLTDRFRLIQGCLFKYLFVNMLQ